MSTRFYLPSSGAAGITVANDAWSKTTGAASALSALRSVRLFTAMATITNTNDGTSGNTVLLRQYVTEALPFAQTVSGLVYGQMRCIESSAAANHNLAFSIRACSADGSTIRSPALLAITSSDSSSAPNEMPTSLTNRPLQNASEAIIHTLTACSVLAGDHLVIEFGYRSGTTTTSRTGGISFGDDSTTDLAYGDVADTNPNNPWIEFSQNLFVLPGVTFFNG